MQVDICCNHVLLGTGDNSGIEDGKAFTGWVWSKWTYPWPRLNACPTISARLSLYTSLLPQSVTLFLLCLTLFRGSVPLFPFLRSSTITLWLLLLHFGKIMLRLLLHHFNTTDCACAQLTIYGYTHIIHIPHVPNCPRTIKVWRIYIQTQPDYTARLVASC